MTVTTTHQQAVGIRTLERVLGKLADKLCDGQSVVLTDVVQQAQRMVLKHTSVTAVANIRYWDIRVSSIL